MNPDKTSRLTVRTPEGIVFSLLLAGPVTRFLAWSVDFLCILAGAKAIQMIGGVVGVVSRDMAGAVGIIAYFVISVGYGIFMEWHWQGQTIGKRLLRLRVMDEQGLHMRFSQIVIRNLLRFVDSLPAFYLVGGISCLFSKNARRLGDIAGGTIVVRNPEIGEPDMSQLLDGKFNSFSEYPHLAARLRQNTSPQEADIALRAILRRDTLEPDARIELFREVADHFRGIVTFPQEITDGLSDEQYVRNVADLLFRAAG